MINFSALDRNRHQFEASFSSLETIELHTLTAASIPCSLRYHYTYLQIAIYQSINTTYKEL